MEILQKKIRREYILYDKVTQKTFNSICLQVALIWFVFASLAVATHSYLHAHDSRQAVERNPLNPARYRTCAVVVVEIDNSNSRHHRQG